MATQFLAQFLRVQSRITKNEVFMMDVISFRAIDNSNRYEARKAFLADSKSFEAPPSANASPPVSPPSNSKNETYSNSQYDYHTDSAFMQVDAQRKPSDFSQQNVNEEEEDEEDKKSDGLVEYLLEALDGKEKEVHASGNSYMSPETKLEYYQNNFPGLFNPSQGL
jgi:hypothetical protein